MRPKSKATGQAPSFIEAARRKQIVLCAIETIAEIGYARASLAEIAKRAGISKGVISYHFAGKDDLIREVMNEVFSAGSEDMEGRVTAETTAFGMLTAYIRENLTYMRTHRSYMLAIVEIVMGHRAADGSPLFDQEMVEAGLAPLEGIIRFGQQAGEFRQFSPRTMARAIRATIDAVPPEMARQPDLDIDAEADEIIEMFARATRADPLPGD